jgi:AAHS family 4-hydroxybenzoate transporter-like MFS transporter
LSTHAKQAATNFAHASGEIATRPSATKSASKLTASAAWSILWSRHVVVRHATRKTMNEINISNLVDAARLRRFHLWLAFWCLLAMMADGFDLLNASIAGPALIKEWGISRAALGPVFSASLVGFFVGAPFFGYLGDRFGRRLAIISSLLFIGVTTLACAWASDLQQLLWLRFFSGLGLGGVLPNVIALNAEFTPKRVRATMLVIMSMGISLGGAIPGIVGVTLMPSYGWPVIFVIGGVIPIVIGLCLILAIPDSIKFMVLRGDRHEAVARLVRKLDPALIVAPATRFVLNVDEGEASTRGSPAALFRNGWASVTVLVWMIFILNLMANNLMNAWLPMIVQVSGHSAAQGSYAGSLYQLGGSAGGLLIGILIDRFGLKVLVIMFAIAAPVLAFTGTPGISDTTLLTMAFLCGCVVVGMQNGLNASAGLIYPTALRANGVGYALGVGRVGSIAGPLIGSLLTGLGMPAATFFYVTAIAPLLCAVAVTALLKRLNRTRQAAIADAAPVSAA